MWLFWLLGVLVRVITHMVYSAVLSVCRALIVRTTLVSLQLHPMYLVLILQIQTTYKQLERVCYYGNQCQSLSLNILHRNSQVTVRATRTQVTITMHLKAIS